MADFGLQTNAKSKIRKMNCKSKTQNLTVVSYQ
jgi:hypothetical protein